MNESGKGSFGGAGSFLTNYYAIWRKGLNEELPNPYGVKQGETYAQRMFYNRSMDPRASFYKFYNYLIAIAEKEANKEREFVEKELERMGRNGLTSKHLQAAERAIKDDNFGMAYSLMLRNEEEYNQLVKEFHGGKFKNISHTNGFFAKEFFKFLERKFSEQLEVQDEKIIAKFYENSNITVDSLVEEWVAEILNGSSGVVMSSVNKIKKDMKELMLDKFKKAGISGVDSIYDNIFGYNNDISKLTNNQTVRGGKSNRRRPIKSLTREISENLARGVANGMAQELAAMEAQGRKGLSISAGKLLKNIRNEFTNETHTNVQQKVDGLSFVLYDSTIDIYAIAKEIFGDSADISQEQINQLIQKLEEQAGATDKIFMVTTNIKGYKSRMNMTIAKSASYSQRISDLIHMAQEAEGMPPLSMEKLGFMFVNTMKGCLQENRIHYIEEYVAAICAAWLWDDYGELFSLEERKSPIKKIRMFASGGFYYSASQLIKTAAEQLKNETDKSKNFVKVDFKTPTFNADGYYVELKNKYPVPEGETNYTEWQNALKPRWDAMRDKVLKEGKIHITIVQKNLESILGELKTYF